FPRVFDRPFERDFVAIDFVADLVSQSVHNVLGRDGSKSLTGLAGREDERHARLADPTRNLFGLVQLARFALSAFLLQIIKLTQRRRRDLVGLAPWQEIIARVTATHFDDICFSAESG